VQDGHGVDGIDEEVVVDGAVPRHVGDAVQRQRQEEIDVNANTMLTDQFSADKPRDANVHKWCAKLSIDQSINQSIPK